MNQRFDVRYFAVAFFIAAVVLRLMPHAYNLAAVGALGMFVGCFWSGRIAVLMSLAAMALSDSLGHLLGIPSMGFYATWLLIVVYAATASSAGVGKLMGWLRKKVDAPLLVAVPLGAIAATGLFFLITNFASWIDPQMGYPRTLAGLIECYALALPFAKNTLIGNLVYSGLFFGSYAIFASPALARSSVK